MKLIPDEVIRSQWGLHGGERSLKIAGFVVVAVLLVGIVVWAFVSYSTKPAPTGSVVQPTASQNASGTTPSPSTSRPAASSTSTLTPETVPASDSAVTAAEKQKILDAMRKQSQ